MFSNLNTLLDTATWIDVLTSPVKAFPLISILGLGVGGGGGGPGPGFDPVADLAGTQRVIADYWDSTSHFKAVPGSFDTAVSTTGEAVGFVMDKSKFSSHDTASALITATSERLTNGDFSSAGSWTTSNTTITGGVVQFSGTSGAYVEQNSIADEDNQWYLVQIEISSFTSGSFRVSVGGGAAANSNYYTPSGAETVYCWKQSDQNGTTNYFRIEANTTGPFNGDITFASVKKIPGNHLKTSSTAQRPFRQQDGNSIWYLDFDGGDVLWTDAVTWPSGFWVVVMGNPNAVTHANYDGLISMDSTDRWNFGNSTSNAGDWRPGLHEPGTTEIWNAGADDETLRIWEIRIDDTDDEYEIYRDNSSLVSTTSNTFNIGSAELNSMASANRGAPLDGICYGVYLYADSGGRDADLYTFINDNTGNVK